jgi:hypothetical protein
MSRRALREINPDLLLENDASFAGIISDSLALERTQSGFAVMIGSLSAIVAGVGLYALVAFMVAGRRREFGIRLALGSEPRRLFRDAITGPLALVGMGLGLGLVFAMLLVSNRRQPGLRAEVRRRHRLRRRRHARLRGGSRRVLDPGPARDAHRSARRPTRRLILANLGEYHWCLSGADNSRRSANRRTVRVARLSQS